MEDSARLRTLQKAYRLHITRILNKVDDTLANDINEQITNLVQDPDELETAILEAEELQDLILEKINELNQRVDTLSRQTTVVSAASQQTSGDKVTSEATHENVSATSSTQPINTIISDTPAVSASTVVASDSIPTTSITLEPVPPPISVSSTSYPAVTYVHSSGPPWLIPASTTLFPQLSTLNLGVSNFPSLARVSSTTSPSMGPNTTTTMDHNHTQQFAASRLLKLTLTMFSGNPLAWLTFWDSFQAAIHLNHNLSGVQKFNYLKAQLQGDAARTIKGIPLCDHNYLHAVTLLQDRFGQTHKLVAVHMQALLEVPNPTNTLSSLRTFHDTIESHTCGLSSLGKPEESYGDLLVPIIPGKVPKDRTWQEVPQVQSGNFHNSCQPSSEKLKF